MTENGGAARIRATRFALKAPATKLPPADPQKLDLLVRVQSEMLEQQAAADLVRAADARDPDDAAFQILDAFDRRLDHEAEKRRFDAVREGADGRAARRRADGRAEHLDIIDVAAEERGDVDRRTRLYQLGREAVSCVEASVFGDKGGEERQRVVGVGNADLFFSGENARGDEHRCEHYGNRPDEHE